MHISGNGRAHELANLLFGVQDVDRPVKSPSDAKPARQDQVEISANAKEILRLKELVNGPDEAREARIAQLRQAVDTGTYHVDGHTAADKVIRHVLMDTVL